MKLIGIVVAAIILIVGGAIISGRPNGCSKKANDQEKRKLTEVEQEINLFLAGEKNQLTVSEGEIKSLIEDRLILPSEINICFEESGGIASGNLKIFRKDVGWLVGGKVKFDQVNPQAVIARAEMGGSRQVPGLSWLLKREAEKRINRKLKGIFVGYPYRVIWERGKVNLRRM